LVKKTEVVVQNIVTRFYGHGVFYFCVSWWSVMFFFLLIYYN